MNRNEPLSATQERLAAALAKYREKVLQHNRQRLVEVIQQVNDDHGGEPADPEDEEDCESRLVDIDEMWFSYSSNEYEFPPDVRTPEDILTVAGAIPDGTIPPISPEARDQALQELERDMKAMAAPGWAESITVPQEYVVLMSMVDGLTGAGLPAERETNSCQCILSVRWGKVLPLAELTAKLGLSPEIPPQDTFNVVAGWLTGYYDSDGTCGIVYCQRGATHYRRDPNQPLAPRPWAWRIVFRLRNDDEPFVYDDVSTFLKWYSEFPVRGWRNYDDERNEYYEIQ